MSQEKETVTFFSCFEGRPSRQRINVCGGVKVKDANGQIAVVEPMLEAQFSDGKFTTDNPKIIAVLREKCKKAECGITEDREKYLSWVLSPEKQNERLAAKLAEAGKERNRLMEELAQAKKANPYKAPPKATRAAAPAE